MSYSKHLATAEKVLLKPGHLTRADLYRVLSQIMTPRIDYADLFFHQIYTEHWMLEDSTVKGAGFCIDKGVGIRAIVGEKTGFAFSNDINLASLRMAAKTAKHITTAKGGGKKITLPLLKQVKGLALYPTVNPVDTLREAQKVKLLQKVNREVHRLDSRVFQTNIELASSYEVVLVASSDGVYAADLRPLVRLSVIAMVEQNGRREQGLYVGGGRAGYEIFQNDDVLSDYARAAVHEAVVNLEAVEVPAGNFPVVLAPGWPAVLLHEAVGHGLEGDFIRKGSSAFSDRIGEQVASPLCTIVDDGTLCGSRGSLNIDDEGVIPQYTVLIQNGILKGFMLDKLNARLLNMQPTGNARRQGHSSLPYPRMTNTYMLPGQYEEEEIIRSIKKGIYAVNLGGGEVDITSGKFVFSLNQAYLIENGRITVPIKNATLIGHGSDVLKKISMVGNKLKLDSGLGVCGKNGQSLPVAVGQPMVKVDEMTVGGTAL